MYGPTETTVWSTASEVFKDKPIHVGKPILNTDIKILSAFGSSLLPGMVGELVIGGNGLSKGYYQRDKLNKEKFITLSGNTYYKTGDVAYINKDGDIHCLGRQDDQVKVNGHRIELGEIESVTKEVSGVIDAVCNIYMEDNIAQIAVYVTTHCTNEVKLNLSVRNEWSQRLAPHMTPSHFIVIDKIPQTPNGKVDRKNLPLPMNVSKFKFENTVSG
jgi:acyl-coenzyme A synthetase/AMP-(fatty) acid ligase